MEVVPCSEPLVNVYQATRRYTPEDISPHSHQRVNSFNVWRALTRTYDLIDFSRGYVLDFYSLGDAVAFRMVFPWFPQFFLENAGILSRSVYERILPVCLMAASDTV
jgi:hypothetical protein